MLTVLPRTTRRSAPVPRNGLGERRGAAARRAFRVAVVEDELMVAWFLEGALEDMRYEVGGLFPTGEAALADFGGDMPDAVLMDINLGSGIDGVETARRIREESSVPIIFLSAYSDPATRERVARTVDNSWFLSKPTSLRELERVLDAAVGGSR